MAFSPDFASRVKSSADIVRIVGESVRLKKAGSNWIGLCPFHQEKTPSFSVHSTKQFYYCFGCGAKGDVFRFVMETERVDFPESLRRVAQRTGIPIPTERADVPTTPEQRLRRKLGDLHEAAAAFFQKQLRSPAAAPLRELMRTRGVKSVTVDEFGLGYAPPGPGGLAAHLRREGFKPEDLEGSGLVVKRDSRELFDRFRNRWIFPIASEGGNIVAFGARALGDERPKYLNSPETALYSKSRVLYNLSRAREAIRKAGRAVLVEGYMDAIAVHQAGVLNVVASCGTALTATHARLLAKHTDEVIVNYDPDTAGVAAADRSLSILLEEGLSVRVLRLSGGLDPDQFIRQNGEVAYRDALAEAPPFFQYLVTRAMELHGTASPEAKLASVNFILPYLSRVPNDLIRAELGADIAQKMDIDSAVIRGAFQKAAVSRRPAIQESPVSKERIPSAEGMLIRLMLEEPVSRQEVLKLLQHRGLVEEMACKEIISELLGMLEEGIEPDLAALSDRLPEAQQRALAEVAFQHTNPVSADEINTYVFALERRRLRRMRDALQRRILEAQKAQDHRMAVELLQDQRELDRKLTELL
jgi:DNA primase